MNTYWTKKTFHPSYTGGRKDIMDLIHKDTRRILDIGCAAGELARIVKGRRETPEIIGIEVDEEMARAASKTMDRVIVGDVEEVDLGEHFPKQHFDCIILADVLEHLREPWRTLQRLVEYLTEDGTVIASIPNVRHYSTLVDLAVAGNWPYRTRGIHDNAHLRFFALRNIRELFRLAGLRILDVKRDYRLLEGIHGLTIPSRLSALVLYPFRDFMVFKYTVIASRNADNRKRPSQ